MIDFAKLYQTERGQILVKLDSDEDGSPEIRFYVNPEDLGLNSLAFGYEDSEKGWEDVKEGFAKVDFGMACRVAKQIYEIVDCGMPVQ